MQRLSKAREWPGVRQGLRMLAALALTLPAAAAVAAAQTGTIVGTITDQSSKTPVPSAEVQIVGSTRGVISGTDGHYRIIGLPSGPTQIRVSRIGYAAATQTVTVPTADVATADFILTPTQITLDQVVVTATQTNQRERENGNALSTIAADSVSQASISTFSDLLTAKASNVDVTQSSGEVGTGSRIRIRGSNSVSLANDPLLVVDGIYVSNDANSLADGFAIGGQTPSRFDDLNTDDIESVEILKGPAASALYGTAGANGVILVTTKKGVSGHAQWNAHAEYGTLSNATSFPGNWGQVGTVGAQTTTGCALILQGLGDCTATPGQLLNWNPLQSSQFSPFTKGNRRQAFGASVAGGTDNSKFFISGDYDNTHGLYANNFQSRNNARGNFQGSVSPKFDYGVNAGFLQSRAQLPQNDNDEASSLASGYLGAPINDPATHGYALVTPQEQDQLISSQAIERFTGGGNANWRPLGWLTITGIAGLDFSERNDDDLTPPGVLPAAIFGLSNTGTASSAPFQFWTYTAQVNGQASYDVSSSIHGTSSIGTQYQNNVSRGTTASGIELVPGTASVAGATAQFTAAQIGNNQIVTIGYYGQQQFGWRDKVFLTGALRADDNSAFGQNFKLAYYPSVSGSWVIGEEPWFPKSSTLSSLRLRSAFGYSGQHPNFEQAQTFYNTISYHDPFQGELPGITIGGIGNANLKPERSHEIEGGFDAGLFKDRISINVTAYAKTTDQALIAVNLPPSIGGIQTGNATAGTSTAFENIGEVTNRGLEIGITSTIFSTRDARLEFTANGSMNKNKLITLGPGIPPIPIGLASISGQFIQQQNPGYSLGSFFQQSYTYSDANHDGIIEPNEINLASNSTFKGNPFPEQLISLQPTLTFLRYFKLSTLFDFRGVSYTYNATAAFKCSLEAFANCQGDYDPHTPQRQQAAIAADLDGSDAGFIENSSFWKWRELSLTASAPDRLAALARVHALSITVAGRNLRTWTKYTGVDPEVNFNGSDNFTVTDFFTQPLIQYWTARINLTF